MNTNQSVILKEYRKPYKSGDKSFAKFRCGCGRIFDREKCLVTSGKRPTCGKGKCNIHVLRTVGKRFGYLTVMYHVSRDKGYCCKCDCGKEVLRDASQLRGKYPSCGCHSHEGVAKSKIKPHYTSLKNKLFKQYKKGAIRRGYIFDLAYEQFEKLLTENCSYCGTPPNSTLDLGHRGKYIDYTLFKYNGIDRFDNKEGYTVANSVPCCKLCNSSKSALTKDEWFALIKRIAAHQKFYE